MTVLRSIMLFGLAALAEIGGAWLVWQGVREQRGVVLIGAGIVALGVYGFVATFQPDPHFGRILAAYGVFVVGSLAWGVVVDSFRPDRYDLLGAALCLVGGGDHVRATRELGQLGLAEQGAKQCPSRTRGSCGGWSTRSSTVAAWTSSTTSTRRAGSRGQALDHAVPRRLSRRSHAGRRPDCRGRQGRGAVPCSGTHKGTWCGYAPTGRRFERVDEVYIFRLRDVWVPENRSWVLSCEFVREAIGPR
jgi:small multidrug resistance family-3 protein